MELKVKLLSTNSRMPTQATAGAACFDLYVSTATALRDGVTEYGLGVAIEIPEGHFGILSARSSISERGQVVCNSIGIIDSDYRGELKLRTFRVSDVWEYYRAGERCAQLLILPKSDISLKEVRTLTETDRGTGGFGSTGR